MRRELSFTSRVCRDAGQVQSRCLATVSRNRKRVAQSPSATAPFAQRYLSCGENLSLSKAYFKPRDRQVVFFIKSNGMKDHAQIKE